MAYPKRHIFNCKKFEFCKNVLFYMSEKDVKFRNSLTANNYVLVDKVVVDKSLPKDVVRGKSGKIYQIHGDYSVSRVSRITV